MDRQWCSDCGDRVLFTVYIGPLKDRPVARACRHLRVEICGAGRSRYPTFSLSSQLYWYIHPIYIHQLRLLSDNHIEESLTVLRGLGIQISTTSATYLQPPTTRFIPTTSIQDIFIYEAFKGFEVRFYLAIVVEGEEDVVVVFPNLLPKRAILEDVWRGTRKCLWEDKVEGRPQVNENKVKGEELR
jgi:hypothetical protein